MCLPKITRMRTKLNSLFQMIINSYRDDCTNGLMYVFVLGRKQTKIYYDNSVLVNKKLLICWSMLTLCHFMLYWQFYFRNTKQFYKNYYLFTQLMTKLMATLKRYGNTVYIFLIHFLLQTFPAFNLSTCYITYFDCYANI